MKKIRKKTDGETSGKKKEKKTRNGKTSGTSLLGFSISGVK